MPVVALTAICLAGCISENQFDNDGDQINGKRGPYYLSVNFASTDIGNSRAAEFDEGTPEESGTSEGLFFIFSPNGNKMYGEPQRIALTAKPTQAGENRGFESVLVVDDVALGNGPSAGMQVVCVVNAPTGLETGVTTLQNLLDKTGDYSQSSPNSFIMTNAVYKNGSSTVVGTPIAIDNIATSREQALKNPVLLNLERVVAKIRVKGDPQFSNKGVTLTVDGVEKHLNIKIKAISLVNTLNKAYLFKNISGINQPWEWSDPIRQRCYWETTPLNALCSQKSFNDYVSTSASVDFSDMTSFDYTAYTLPNTGSEKKTTLLLCAQLCDENGNPFPLAFFRGAYYSWDKISIAYSDWLYQCGYCMKNGEKWIPILTGEFRYFNEYDNVPDQTAGLKSYECVAFFPPYSNVIYKKGYDSSGNETYIPIPNKQELNALCKTEKLRIYFGGQSYYFVNIDHSQIANLAPHALEGVVRNICYNLTIKSVGGLGTPVFDPSDPIDPEEADPTYSMRVEMSILPWRVALNSNSNVTIK